MQKESIIQCSKSSQLSFTILIGFAIGTLQVFSSFLFSASLGPSKDRSARNELTETFFEVALVVSFAVLNKFFNNLYVVRTVYLE